MASYAESFINTTKSIEWSRLAADVHHHLNKTVVRTGQFVSENIWASDLFQATVISSLFLVAYWSIIYLDSSQPGVNPPSPLAAMSRQKFHHQRQAQFHLNYILGAVISSLLFLSLYFHVF